jgi:hypothetical protein
MKTRLLFCVLFISSLLFTTYSLAAVNKTNNTPNTYETIEQNRLIGLASDNAGLRVSCAFNLGEMKSVKAVIPLIQLLREGNTDEERIIAALSLIKIGDAQGVYMVKRLAVFHPDDRTRRMCQKFYNGYLYQKYIEKNPDKIEEVALNY